MAKKEEIATQEPGSALAVLKDAYPALAGGGDVAAAMEANLGGEEITVFDLEQIRVGRGGMTAWEVPTGDGEVDYPKTVDGIVVFHKIGRSYWSTAYGGEGGGTPPDCSSSDGKVGHGNPGGLCADCEFAQWDSKVVDGEHVPGQACSQRRFMFLLREGHSLPSVVNLPPTSLKPVKQWLMQITNKGKPYWHYVVRFSLAEAKSKGGIKYAQARVAVVRELTPEEIGAVTEFAVKTRDTFVQYREGVGEPQQEA